MLVHKIGCGDGTGFAACQSSPLATYLLPKLGPGPHCPESPEDKPVGHDAMCLRDNCGAPLVSYMSS